MVTVAARANQANDHSGQFGNVSGNPNTPGRVWKARAGFPGRGVAKDVGYKSAGRAHPRSLLGDRPGAVNGLVPRLWLKTSLWASSAMCDILDEP